MVDVYSMPWFVLCRWMICACMCARYLWDRNRYTVLGKMIWLLSVGGNGILSAWSKNTNSTKVVFFSSNDLIHYCRICPIARLVQYISCESFEKMSLLSRLWSGKKNNFMFWNETDCLAKLLIQRSGNFKHKFTFRSVKCYILAIWHVYIFRTLFYGILSNMYIIGFGTNCKHVRTRIRDQSLHNISRT